MNRRRFFTTLVGAFLAPTVVRLSNPKPKRLEFPLGLIQRVWPSSLASDLIKVRPMSGPNDTVFYSNLIDASKPSSRISTIFGTASTPTRWKITY